MAIRNIVKHGDAILREKSRPVTVFDKGLHMLIDDMIDTMHSADGVGLAAVQVGSLRRVFVASPDGSKVIELVNPVVLEAKGEQVYSEGCLSIPGRREEVTRPQYLKIKAADRFGNERIIEAEDFLAVVFSHELDHLDGVLFLDRVEN